MVPDNEASSAKSDPKAGVSVAELDADFHRVRGCVDARADSHADKCLNRGAVIDADARADGHTDNCFECRVCDADAVSDHFRVDARPDACTDVECKREYAADASERVADPRRVRARWRRTDLCVAVLDERPNPTKDFRGRF